VNPVLTADEYENILLAELDAAHAAVRKAVIAGLLPHWTAVGRHYVTAAEQAAREDVKSIRSELEHLRARQSPPPARPPKPAPRASTQLELFPEFGPIPTRKRSRPKPR
jgi:hypothetical protein